MKKRWIGIALLLCLALLLTGCEGVSLRDLRDPDSAPATPMPDIASGSCGVDTEWRLDAHGVLHITGWGPMRDYWGSEVRKGGWPGWHDYADILTGVRIEDGVTAVGAHCFEDCTALTEVSFPKSVTRIGASAFLGCTALTELPLPEELDELGASAFENCTALVRLELPKTVRLVGNELVRGCDSLTEITVEPGSEDFASRDGALFNKAMTRLLAFPRGRTGSYALPEGVISAAEGCLAGCSLS